MSLPEILKPSSTVGRILFLGLLVLMVYSVYSGYFETLEAFLGRDEFTFNTGVYKINLYKVLSFLLLVLTSFWITAIASSFIEKRILNIRSMRNSSRVLFAKIAQLALYIVAFLIVLKVIGMDLTAFSIFGGAIGIGLGFGLQKTASNFISGLILLYEKTIDLGDLIELSDGTMGFVKRISGRYTLIETFESKEIIVPNEDLMTGKVVNHTLSNTAGRIDIEVGVSYSSDIQKAHQLIIEAAKEYSGTISTPEAHCFLSNFGNSSVDFILHFWVSDVKKGRFLPKSDVLFSIWSKFKENGIEIPFPQRDLHLKTVRDDITIVEKSSREDRSL